MKHSIVVSSPPVLPYRLWQATLLLSDIPRLLLLCWKLVKSKRCQPSKVFREISVNWFHLSIGSKLPLAAMRHFHSFRISNKALVLRSAPRFRATDFIGVFHGCGH